MQSQKIKIKNDSRLPPEPMRINTGNSELETLEYGGENKVIGEFVDILENSGQ